MEGSYKLYYWSLKISTLKRHRKLTIRRLKKAAIEAIILDRGMILREAQGETTKGRQKIKRVLSNAKELRRAELEKRTASYA